MFGCYPRSASAAHPALSAARDTRQTALHYHLPPRIPWHLRGNLCILVDQIAGVRGRGVVFRRAGPVADLIIKITQVSQLRTLTILLDRTGQLAQRVVTVTPRPAIRQRRSGTLVLVVQRVTVDRSIVHCNVGQPFIAVVGVGGVHGRRLPAA